MQEGRNGQRRTLSQKPPKEHKELVRWLYAQDQARKAREAWKLAEQIISQIMRKEKQ